MLQAVTAAGYTNRPRSRPKASRTCLPAAMLGIAQTGTGKTAAFTLPMLTLLETGRPGRACRARSSSSRRAKLAAQVEESFEHYGRQPSPQRALLIGGVSFGDQDMKLARGVDVLIATPGRLLDHFERGKLLLTGVELLVIDEADRMLDMGFIPDIERIVKLSPSRSRRCSSRRPCRPRSAASPKPSCQPVRIEVAARDHGRDGSRSTWFAVGREPHDKRDALRELIRASRTSRTRSSSATASARSTSCKLAEKARLRTRRHSRGPRPVARMARSRASATASSAPGRVGRGGPRPRHPGREPRLQLRRAAPCRGLCPPHRPHRPRRPLGPGVHDRDARRQPQSWTRRSKLIGQDRLRRSAGGSTGAASRTTRAGAAAPVRRRGRRGSRDRKPRAARTRRREPRDAERNASSRSGAAP